MDKYGFFAGFLMGIERIYIRENGDMQRRLHYYPIAVGGEIKVYDPPEANAVFRKTDWRVLRPDFDLAGGSPGLGEAAR